MSGKIDALSRPLPTRRERTAHFFHILLPGQARSPQLFPTSQDHDFRQLLYSSQSFLHLSSGELNNTLNNAHQTEQHEDPWNTEHRYGTRHRTSSLFPADFFPALPSFHRKETSLTPGSHNRDRYIIHPRRLVS